LFTWRPSWSTLGAGFLCGLALSEQAEREKSTQISNKKTLSRLSTRKTGRKGQSEEVEFCFKRPIAICLGVKGASMAKSAGTKRVVIVGGGFVGLNCAQRLAAHEDLQITLLDKNNYQQFQPLLYQVATATLSPDNAAFNLRAVLATHDNVDVTMAEVRSVDLATRTAYTVNGHKYEGEFLVLAAGAEANFFGIPGVRGTRAAPVLSVRR
jgi:NADPH-dependent 2,4-dienoyl-CoA reductase/sulfur reductase-like enzyme